jgi:3-oxoacyl-[acyl-carrier protein] reductase
MELDGAVALVTGGSKGIGLAIAESLAAENCRLVISARGEADLAEAAHELRAKGAEVQTVAGDVGDEVDAARMLEAATKTWGRIDLLVNNAGVSHHGPVEETPLDVWDNMFRTNVRGPFLLIRGAAPHMREQGGGTIVNVSSLAGKNPVPNMAGYAATKWALNGFSSSILGELRRDNIRIIVVNPGSTATKLLSRPDKLDRIDRILQPVEVAETLLQALKLPDRALVSEIDIRPTIP